MVGKLMSRGGSSGGSGGAGPTTGNFMGAPLNPSLKNLEEEVKEELELRKKKEPLLYSIPSFATANQPVRLAGG
jgi:hypothetical protein